KRLWKAQRARRRSRACGAAQSTGRAGLRAGTDLVGQPDPRLAGAADVARTAAEQEGGSDAVGAYVDAQAEEGGAVTHLFEANYSGYQGWRWAVTVACASRDEPV